MKIKRLLAFMIACSGTIQAQQEPAKIRAYDSLTAKLKADSTYIYRYKAIRPYINLEFTNAYIGDGFISIMGLRGGVVLQNKHILGAGFYSINKFPIIKSEGMKYEFKKMNYATVLYEYILYDKRYYELVFPFEVGYGNYTADVTGDSVSSKVVSNMTISGLGVKFMVMPHRWVGIKFGVGYRMIWENTADLNLNAPYYSVGIRFDLDETSRGLAYFFTKRKYKKNIRHL